MEEEEEEEDDDDDDDDDDEECPSTARRADAAAARLLVRNRIASAPDKKQNMQLKSNIETILQFICDYIHEFNEILKYNSNDTYLWFYQ